MNAAENKELPDSPVTNFSAVPGKGICGTLNGKDYLIGTEKFLAENGISSEAFAEQKAESEKLGHTVVILSDKNMPLALLTT